MLKPTKFIEIKVKNKVIMIDTEEFFIGDYYT